MTTVELILSGLLLVSLPDESKRDVVVVFPDDDNHAFNLVLLKGDLDPACTGWQRPPGHRPVKPLSQDDLVLSINGTGGVKMMELVNILPGGEVPQSAEEATSFNWVPSLSPMIMGASRLRKPCGDPSKGCPSTAARFFIDRGRFTSCHLVHRVDTGTPSAAVRLYRLPNGQTSALSDTISVKQTWGGSEVRLVISGDGRCILKPDGGAIELFVANAPKKRHEAHAAAVPARRASPSPPPVEFHFPRLHRYSHWFFQRMDRSRPDPLGERCIDASLLGSCEEQIIEAQKSIATLPSTAYAHTPSECGTAQQP